MSQTWYNSQQLNRNVPWLLATVGDAGQSEKSAMSDSSVTQLGLFDTIEIPLTKGYITVIDAVDADLAKLFWHASVSSSGKVYAYSSPLNGISFKMHGVILERIIGRILAPLELVDHKDGDSLNNRRENLRVASYSQNRINSKRPTSRNYSTTSKAGFRGVYFVKKAKKWRSRIGVNGKKIVLGYFDTPEEAYAAYCEAAKKYHGEFARFD